jgi:signal transduction histidine kinase
MEARRAAEIGLLRIASKVFLVGAIPIAIGAVIAATAWVFLREAEQARSGALLAGSIYRDLLLATAERDRFVIAPPMERTPAASRFFALTTRARSQMMALSEQARTPTQAEGVERAAADLRNLTDQMGRLVDAADQNERRVREMAERAASLITLTDQARTRQHASNADIVATLAEKDRRLRLVGEIVDRAQDLRALVAGHAARGAQESLARVQVRNAALDLSGSLRQADRGADADSLMDLARRAASGAEAGTEAGDTELLSWTERLLKVDETDRRSLHEEVAQLLTYAVQANETEQATQNIAIAALKLGQRTAEALAIRDIGAAAALAREGETLADTVGSLPISPLIQSEMIDAIRAWNDRLLTTTAGLRQQNTLLEAMDKAVVAATEGARSLNDTFIGDADRLGGRIRTTLFVGATTGLLLGALAALLVAQSITGPLRRVQRGMLQLAAEPGAGTLEVGNSKDELGDMARAANTFVTEIGVREQALRDALADLRRTQAELIQSEKMASLGQLVAGVAHEINTPVGVALTTATQMGEEARHFVQEAEGAQLRRSRLLAFVERMNEGSRLLYANLTRAADLVQSFKQVAADQVSGEHRTFDLKDWLPELVTSLGPVLRKRGLSVRIDCPEGLTMSTFPGALGQVVTNLVVNAAVHGYPPGQPGTLHLSALRDGPGRIALVVADDGKGMPPDVQARIFDPFFTTARQHGSTGLGLHIVYNLVVQTLKGRIAVDSAPGRGTRFTVTLPVSVPAAETPGPS